MSDVTRLLVRISNGDRLAAEELLPLVYDELRRIAAVKLAQEQPGQTLQATALVHEAYLRLVGPENSSQWDNCGHFFAAAAEAMRRILIEQARRKNASKRGGSMRRIELSGLDPAVEDFQEDLVALDDALRKLEQQDEPKARLVKLRFFAGLTIEQAAEAMGISTSTADNYWAYARCWLRVEMDGVT